MLANKPTLYPDTNIFSSIHYNGGSSILLRRCVKTREWWNVERRHFHLVSSKLTEDELSAGVYSGQDHALAAARRLPYLTPTADVKRCATVYLECGVVPANKVGDAAQLAFTVVHRVDYLLTWNHAHLANVEIVKKLNAVNARNGWRTPLIVTPESIPWNALGQSIRRRDEA